MSIFGYFQLGLSAMNAARLGLQVAGDNIANVDTPGFSRRRAEVVAGFPVRVTGGLLDHGVEVASIRRMEDRFLRDSLEREHGRFAGEEQRLRGLRGIESIFGTLEGEGIATALSGFATAFDRLAGQPESSALRQGAVEASEALARSIRQTYQRLQEQRRLENQTVGDTVERINTLAAELAKLNRDIAAEEADGTVAAPLRDRREQLTRELAELTGGTAAPGKDGRLSFSLPGGPTLVTGDSALPLTLSRAADGTSRVHSGADGSDITDRLRGGELGALLYIRDEALPERLDALDELARDVITRANALTESAFDLQGAPGAALFLRSGFNQPGIAGRIEVRPFVLADPRTLAVSASGSPGDGSVAAQLAALAGQSSATLNGASPEVFLADLQAALGNEIAQTDVTREVARELVGVLEERRDAVAGVSLDEEAVELVRHQRAFEAAARFLDVMNSITAIAVNIGNR